MLVKPDLAVKYIELLKKSLINELYLENEARIIHFMGCKLNNVPLTFADIYCIDRQKDLLKGLKKSKEIGNTVVFFEKKEDGTLSTANHMRNFTELCHTMIGRKRMDNIQYCLETALDEDVPGDFIETGIW
jgi:O-methyltransferase